VISSPNCSGHDPVGTGQMVIGIRRRQFIYALGGASLNWSFAARGQPVERRRHIAVLMGGLVQGDVEGQTEVAALEEGLKQAGCDRVAILQPVLWRIPNPPTPQCARAALPQGRNPQAIPRLGVLHLAVPYLVWLIAQAAARKSYPDTLRFSADDLPRFCTISNSTVCIDAIHSCSRIRGHRNSQFTESRAGPPRQGQPPSR
jgi:hypothetical protein